MNEMSEPAFWLFVRGLLIGFSIAAPVGPIGVLCIRRTLANGRLSGFVSGMGAATADALYGSLAAFGLTVVTDFLVGIGIWLRLIGGLFLLYLGFSSWRARAYHTDSKMQSGGLARDYGSTLVLTLTNPLTILSFAAIFAGIGLTSQVGSPLASLMTVMGVFSGSALWWLLLSGFAGVFYRRLQKGGLLWVNRISGGIIVTFGFFAIWSGISSVWLPVGSQPPITAGLTAYIPVDTTGNFTYADKPQQLRFPQDEAAHNNFQTDWWYYTGNLQTQDGQRFGYQLTFFRRAVLPPSDRIQRASDWAVEQVYLAHFAITDAGADRHQSFERLARGSAGLAGAEIGADGSFQVWLKDWQVVQTGTETYQLYASAETANSEILTVNLKIESAKGAVLQGDHGYSQKGSDPKNASYYYSLTRLDSTGEIRIGAHSYQVSGSSWMDHEFSTSALSADQVGWDWFSIQLSDNYELMIYQIRRSDGSIDPFSAGVLVAPNGDITRLTRDDFSIVVEDTWKSPHTKGVYPSGWRVEIAEIGLSMQITPLIKDQELNLSYTYWEGAVSISAQLHGQPVSGVGYVELTGYAGSMAGEF